MNRSIVSTNVRLLLSVLCFYVSLFGHASGHGGLLEPPMRSLAWRYGFDAPINYDWMSLYCGGFHKFQQAGGKCGLCGDPYDGPFDNDRGGVYDTGIIVRHYPAGMGEIDVKTEITAHHKGYISFHLCPNNEKTLTQQCLDRYPLMIREAQQQGDPYKFYPPETPKLHELHVMLPQGVICDRCVMQWKYTAGNNVGKGPDGQRCLGCGLQETFINCADISIGGTVDSIPVSKDTVSPGPSDEIVLPQSPDLTNIIDNASPNSFREVLNAIGVTRQDPRLPSPPIVDSNSMNPNTQHIQATRPVRNQNADLPGLTRDQIVDNSRSKGMSIVGQSTASRGRTLNMMAGMDIFGNRLPPSELPRAPIHDPRQLGMTPMMSREEIMRLRARQQNMGSMTPHTGNMMLSDIPPPSQVSDIFRNPQMNSINTMQTPTRGRHITGGSSLLGSITDVVGNIRQNNRPPQQMQTRPNTFQSNSINTAFPGNHFNNGNLLSSVHNNQPTALMHHPNSHPPTQFVNQMNDMRRTFPTNSEWVRADGMSSHRAAVRQSAQMDTRDFSTSEIHNLVPELPRNIGPRQDIGGFMDSRNQHGMMQSRENWFPNSQSFVQDRRMRMHDHTMAKTEPRDRSTSLPRRIVVHSMDIAQHLLRKYPQLRGRVFLSRQAHVRNKYAHVNNKYARRQIWN